jgi:hypothetical protein
MPKLRSRCASAMVSTIFALIAITMPGPAARGEPRKEKDKQAEQSKYQPSTDRSQYVGAEICKTCHEDMPSKGFYKNYEDSPHFVTTLDIP